tara:strand:- start:2549 stop:2899 length:351 start_codon:yes stop_codon:yes gene_type:complete
MKSSQLKVIIKEAVREAIQEELKDILLEAVKTPKVITHPVNTVTENFAPPLPPPQSQMSPEEKRNAYQNILGETGAQFTSANVPQSFTPKPGFDTSNGTLPAGEVDMSMIAGLMKK